MSSYRKGKDDVNKWVREHFQKGATSLDVGAGDGIWSDLLRDYLIMDAVEIFAPNITTHRLAEKYRNVYNEDIRTFKHGAYDLIIFGDVIEHMTVEEAQAVLDRAKLLALDVIVAVPFNYKQGVLYGNVYEKHIQDDLTHLLFMERYPGFVPFVIFDNYGYYHLGRTEA